MSFLYLQTGTYSVNGTGGGNSSFLPGASGMTAFSGAYVPPPSPPPPSSGGAFGSLMFRLSNSGTL